MSPLRAMVLAIAAILLASPLGALALPANVPGFAIHAGPPASTAGEPSIGLDPDTGAAMYQAGGRTFRVTFTPAGATWLDASYTPSALLGSFDPYLFTDPDTGRTYAGGDWLACGISGFTDDNGATWTPMANPCATPAFDHSTIGGGAWREPRPSATFHDRAVYYCADYPILECATSLDGGVTFLPPVPIATCGQLGILGHVKVANDGTVYVPTAYCSNAMSVIVSRDNGLTWTVHRNTRSGPTPNGWSDPSVATTTSGWVYSGWRSSENKMIVGLSKNEGRTWSAPIDVTAQAGLTAGTFAAMVAGDDERASLAFLGTNGAGEPFEPSFTGTWYLYTATTLDAGVTWSVARVSDDPVQRGWICHDGAGCSGGRNLLDFMGAVTDPTGRILIAYPDGCTGACTLPNGEGNEDARGTIARQRCGPLLFAASPALPPC